MDIPAHPPSKEEVVCNQVAANVLDNVLKYTSTLTALPLHLAIVSLLFWRVLKRRFYHYLIFIECGTDIAAVGCVLVTHSLCVAFKKLVMNYVTYVSPSIQLILTGFLMVYWKAVVRPQWNLDVGLCITFSVSTTVDIAARIYTQLNSEPNGIVVTFLVINTIGILALCTGCFLISVLVLRMDVSRFSEITLGCILITNIFHLMEGIIGCLSVMDPFVFAANQKIKNVTDPVLLKQFQKEMDDYQGTWLAVKQTISMTSTIWVSYLPLVRSLLIYWAIRPLLQKTRTIVIQNTPSDVASTFTKSFQ